MRKRMKSISLCLILAFSVSTTVSFAAQGGSIGQGDFSVMKGDQVVEQLKGQNPVQDSSMLVCDGKCMIKSEGISLVAADQAKFAMSWTKKRSSANPRPFAPRACRTIASERPMQM